MIENKKVVMQLSQELASMQEKVRAGDASVVASEMVNKQTEVEFIVSIIQEGLDAISALGAHPKDLDLGLVDFPAMIDGEEILLCWKYGEKSIGYYHGPSEGYAGRKPLPK
jgi:hypothetical protein